jgi:hypothetical protein
MKNKLPVFQTLSQYNIYLHFLNVNYHQSSNQRYIKMYCSITIGHMRIYKYNFFGFELKTD